MTYQCSQAIIPSCSLLLLKQNTSSQRNSKLNKKIKRKKQKKLHPGEKKHPKTKNKKPSSENFPSLCCFFSKNHGHLTGTTCTTSVEVYLAIALEPAGWKKRWNHYGVFNARFLAAWPSSARERTTPLATKMTCRLGSDLFSDENDAVLVLLYDILWGWLSDKWLPSTIKWPRTLGSKGHFESAGWCSSFFASVCLVCGYLVALKQHPRKQ